MTARCEWFTGVNGQRCTGLGYIQAGGHWHCQEHYNAHRAEFGFQTPCDGTPADYDRHIKRGETPCTASRYAKSARNAELAKNPNPRPLKPCGTSAAYKRHMAAGETPCQPCIDADRARPRGRKKKAA